MSFLVQATAITIVNYNRKTFIVHATAITIVNYNRKTFTVQATGGWQNDPAQNSRLEMFLMPYPKIWLLYNNLK
jgi:hypothetical protein